MAPMCERPSPPRVVKLPAAYSVLPLRVSTVTVPFAPGFQASAAPVAGSSAARRLRAAPPALANEPPAKTRFV